MLLKRYDVKIIQEKSLSLFITFFLLLNIKYKVKADLHEQTT